LGFDLNAYFTGNITDGLKYKQSTIIQTFIVVFLPKLQADYLYFCLMPPKCPVNYLVVGLKNAYQDEIEFDSGVKLFVDTSYRPEWNTTCLGKVLSIPDKISKRYPSGEVRPEYKGMTIEAKENDDVIFSYMVIEDKEQRPGNTDVHRNQFYHDGKYYWKVDVQLILGYIREGKLVAAQGHIFLKDVEKKAEEKAGSLYLPEMSKTGRVGNRAEVVSVGNPYTHLNKLSAGEGQEIIYDDRYAQRYSIPQFGDIIICDQRYIAAVV
jgi:hypothetical protein